MARSIAASPERAALVEARVAAAAVVPEPARAAWVALDWVEPDRAVLVLAALARVVLVQAALVQAVLVPVALALVVPARAEPARAAPVQADPGRPRTVLVWPAQAGGQAGRAWAVGQVQAGWVQADQAPLHQVQQAPVQAAQVHRRTALVVRVLELAQAVPAHEVMVQAAAVALAAPVRAALLLETCRAAQAADPALEIWAPEVVVPEEAEPVLAAAEARDL